MFLICYGTRPEMIKLFPLIKQCQIDQIPHQTLFSSQHPDLFNSMQQYLPSPDYQLQDIMKPGQSLNRLSSVIIQQMDTIFEKNPQIKYVIVQGDTTTSLSIALAAFHQKKKIIHIEAGLRTYNRYDPYPEEMNRVLISRLATIHFCPTSQGVQNLLQENVTSHVYLVGNTVVDAFESLSTTSESSTSTSNTILVTLHRRENRGSRIKQMWKELNKLSIDYSLIYITHPSLPEARDILSNRIDIRNPVSYQEMIQLILNCQGIITDSGGLQEEAVCAKKKILVCRETTERPETISSGWGLLVGTKISKNIDFLFNKQSIKENPYGQGVSKQITAKMKQFVWCSHCQQVFLQSELLYEQWDYSKKYFCPSCQQRIIRT